MNQGDIWLLETPDSKARPVLIVTRNEAIPVMRAVLVAPITSTIRDIDTCLSVGQNEGIDHDSVASFDSVMPVPKAFLAVRLGSLSPDRRSELCSAMSAALDC